MNRHAHHEHEHGHSHAPAPAQNHHHDHHDHAGHDHHHPAVPAQPGGRFAIGVLLNLGFVALELGYGWWANSLALLADAGHNFGDVLGLLLAWGAAVWSQRAPTAHYTYGWRNSTIWAALMNASLLLIAVGAIGWEALRRLQAPPPVADSAVIAVAAAGVLINLATALLFLRDRHDDLNAEGAYQHMLADAAVSLGVVATGLGLRWTGWQWLDPASSLLVAGVILVGTWGLLKEALRLSMSAVPRHIDPTAVQQWLSGLPGITEVHDLHIWALSTSETALTVHLQVAAGHPGDAFLAQTRHELAERFRVQHATLQIELGDHDHLCELACERPH
jgi:cobalt-zinc-cadmium efflux system protein